MSVVIPALWAGNQGGHDDRGTTTHADVVRSGDSAVRAALAVPEPDRTLAVETPAATDGPTPAQAVLAAVDEPPIRVLTDIEAAICSFGWECEIALRVFACESGPDYIAGYNASGHAGTAQISPIHAWRFAKRGLDFWTDAVVLQWNLEVAYEIWTERWWYAWSCY